MKEISLGDKPHIDLCDLLKVAGMAPTGGVGKHFVAAGEVKVDGAVELRKRAKIRLGQVVEYKGEKVKIV
jgi:ribosome-associated protein